MKKPITVTSKQYKLISLAYRIGGFLLVVGLLFGYSMLIGKPIEFICIFVPYFFTKGYYEKQFHATSLKQCFTLSLLIFAFLTTVSLPTEFSISTAVVIGIIAPYASYKADVIQFKLKDYAYIEPRYNQLVDFYNAHTSTDNFNADKCTKEQLLARCAELGFDEDKTTLAVMLFINKTKHKKIADMLNIEVESVGISKWRMRKILNGENKEKSD